ncbi:MAG TPA: prepilin-type N-terminal cleavage/methylation domain-containing protein [Gemmatimonadaceae bacterium]|nr:prepilin-type N-terminal cleavage/methylation domain-containing protein [Gemmatimonadaceae bacterium]
MKTRAIRSPRRRRPRRGFSLAELLVAMTLLSIVLMSLARITFTMAARGRTNDITAKRNAVLVQEANKFNAMVYDSLATASTAERTLTMGDFSFSRRISITTESATRKTVKIVITPTLDATKKDSVFVHRSKPAGSPLCVGC